MKFSVGEDERPLLVAELPAATLDRDALGLALARELAVADRFLDESLDWLKGGGWPTAPVGDGVEGPGTRLLDRYADAIAELLDVEAAAEPAAELASDADADAQVPA